MGKVHDFRTGENGWGHKIHAGTFREVAPRVTGRWWWRKETPRTSVMVHTSGDPQEGDTLLYTGHDNAERRMTIVEVKPCWDPRDMFTLILERPS